MPRKIEWITFFDHFFDFSMAFGKRKMIPTTFACLLFLFSYLHHSKMYAVAYDKLLRALMASELEICISSDKDESLMLLKPPVALS